MQDFAIKPNFNMNDIQNKNILIPNFNYNYNFNLGQTKPMDPNKIDLYNNSLTIMNNLQNIYPGNNMNANEIYQTLNYSLDTIKENSKNKRLDDISKRAQFYFTLYNLINNKKCKYSGKSEYTCSFINTNLPIQPNNKKIQININNNLFNGGMMNNGIYPFNNKQGILNSNFNNSMSTATCSNMNNNIIFLSDNNNNILNNINNKDNQFIGKKRNLENIDTLNDQKNNNNNLNQPKKKKKKKNKNKLNKRNNMPNNNNNNNQNDNNSMKKNNKKKESPMLQIDNKDLNKINELKNNLLQNNQGKVGLNINNNLFMRLKRAEKEKEENEGFINFDKDLKDYLRRTISENRQIIFFNSILPESVEIVKNLFKKGTNIVINRAYPVYRNTKVELSLIIEPGGKIRKQLTNINS